MIQRWDAIHAAAEASYAMRRLAQKLRKLADADHDDKDECRKHADEADDAAGVVDNWRRSIMAKIPAN